MRIILSGPLTESLGASPLLYGLIWLAGPVTGIVVQPIIGALSDNTFTKFGRRIPYLFFGALFGAIGLILLPKSQAISSVLGSATWLPLFIAAIFIWMIDACVNAAQGPYRALIPDVVPVEQHSVANSYISLAIGLGSVDDSSVPPLLRAIEKQEEKAVVTQPEPVADVQPVAVPEEPVNNAETVKEKGKELPLFMRKLFGKK